MKPDLRFPRRFGRYRYSHGHGHGHRRSCVHLCLSPTTSAIQSLSSIDLAWPVSAPRMSSRSLFLPPFPSRRSGTSTRQLVFPPYPHSPSLSSCLFPFSMSCHVPWANPFCFSHISSRLNTQELHPDQITSQKGSFTLLTGRKPSVFVEGLSRDGGKPPRKAERHALAG